MNNHLQSQKLAIFLSTSGHSGVDRIMKNLIPEIASRGIHVDVLKVKNHGPNLEEIPEGVQIIELGSSHTYTSLPPLVRYLKANQPDALLSDKDKVNRVALIATKLADVKTKVSVRNGTTVSVDLKKRGWLDRKAHYLSMHYLYRNAHAILAPSRGAADDLAKCANISPNKVTSIPNPVVTDKVLELGNTPPTHPWLKEKNSPFIVSVGELSPRKDFATLISSFALVHKQTKAKLVILGEGKQRQHLEELIKELNIENEVSLPGFCDNPYSYMKHADLFVMSSRWEGFGNVLAEALAFGTPCVSTDCPSGPSEILQNGKYGKLVPVGDSEAMASSIIASLENPIPRQETQKGATAFTVETCATAYLNALGITPHPA